VIDEETELPGVDAAGANDDDQESPMGFFRIVVQQDPVDVVGVIGGNAVFTAAFLSGHPGLLTYQWQIRFTSSDNWGNLVETAGFYTGVTTTTLTIRNLDAFLASRPAVQVRCQAVFAHSFAGFTAAATLTIPRYVRQAMDLGATWIPMLGGINSTSSASGGIIVAPSVQAVGFTSPTYAWTQISGPVPDSITNPTTASPAFEFTAWNGQTIQMVWKCTVTDAGGSVDSPALTLLAAPAGLPRLGFPTNDQTAYSENGGNVHPFTFLLPWVGPWIAIETEVYRQLTTPTVTITQPTGQNTRLGISAQPNPGAGVMFRMYSKYGNGTVGFSWAAAGSFWAIGL
jgi:hypothetical protein